MKVTRVLHCSINVEGSLADTARFYRQVLGLSPASRPEIPGIDGAWFDVADGQLHLVDAERGTASVRPADAHVCYGVEDLDAAVAELEAAGVEVVEGAQGTVRQIWFADPAGNIIELQHDP